MMTIIVLLILAGVAISLTIGNNGIFSRAQTAVNTWREAETNEQLVMGELEGWLDGYMNGNGGNQGGDTGDGDYNTATTVTDAIDQNKPFENDTTITDDLENSIRVPEGFKIAEDSATTVEDGIVIEDKDGNQFVWIPAKTEAEGGATINLSAGGMTTIVYQRIAFGGENITSTYTETMPSDEEASVDTWGGYYIGRFEAGDKESTEDETMRKSSTDATVTIKKGQAPYNNITQTNAKRKAEEMDTVQRYNTATTRLISSYAWDTAISFIQIKTSQYGTSSPQGNYKDTTFNYTDITGTEQTKSSSSSVLVPTGQTTAVSNIYDIGGNLREYTTESASPILYPYVFRGGYYSSNYENVPASFRSYSSDYPSSNNGFRVTLYCSTEG